MIYGTAWKEEQTASLVLTAIEAGFRSFDTANQKKHYREDYLGQALLQAKLPRDSLWLQSKYTYARGQDHRLPYDPKASYRNQVRQSFENSLKNLHTDYLDSYLLHGPQEGHRIVEDDLEVWDEMLQLKKEGLVKRVGVSNVSLHHIQQLTEISQHAPEAVQNRCYAVRGWDASVRTHCLENGIQYQGFSLLTANSHVLRHSQLQSISQRLQLTPAQIIFRFAIHLGIEPLTGTSQLQHMQDDLQVSTCELTPADIEILQAI